MNLTLVYYLYPSRIQALVVKMEEKSASKEALKNTPYKFRISLQSPTTTVKSFLSPKNTNFGSSHLSSLG